MEQYFLTVPLLHCRLESLNASNIHRNRNYLRYRNKSFIINYPICIGVDARAVSKLWRYSPDAVYRVSNYNPQGVHRCARRTNHPFVRCYRESRKNKVKSPRLTRRGENGMDQTGEERKKERDKRRDTRETDFSREPVLDFAYYAPGHRGSLNNEIVPSARGTSVLPARLREQERQR